jgi:serine/threonine protein kinase
MERLTPWFRGMVFVTGNKGANLNLDNGGLRVYGPSEIIRQLQTPEKTLHFAITHEQRELLDTMLGLTRLATPAAPSFEDFDIVDRESWDGGFQRWKALVKKNPETVFDLRVADFSRSGILDLVMKKGLERESKILASLGHIPGVQHAWESFESHGLVLVLPLIRPKGRPLSEVGRMTADSWVRIAEWLVEILAKAREQQFVHGNLNLDDLWWDDGQSLLTVCGWGRTHVCIPQADVDFLRRGVRGMVGSLLPAAEVMREWAGATGFDIDPILDLRDRLAALRAEKQSDTSPEAITSELNPGQKIDNDLQLVRFLGSGTTGDAWQARHLAGQFNCVIKFMEVNDEPAGRRTKQEFSCEFEKLRALYHPNLVQVYDAKVFPDQGLHGLVLEYCEKTLRDQIETGERLTSADFSFRLRDCLVALQYLHIRDCHHGDLSPANIGLTRDRAYLLDLGFVSRGISRNHRYRSPYPKKSLIFKDLYALVLSFCEAAVGYPFPGQVPETVEATWIPKEKPDDFAEPIWQRMLAVLRGENPVNQTDKGVSYLDLFGFQKTRTEMQ